MFCEECKHLYYDRLFCPQCDKANSFDEEDICIICDTHKKVHNINVCTTITGMLLFKQNFARDMKKLLFKLNEIRKTIY